VAELEVVWKATLGIVDTQDILVPKGAEFLCVQVQHKQVCVWYRCNPTALKERRTLIMRGTGHPNAVGKYLGTFYDGDLVFHVFEQKQWPLV
jgi:hypothetical protein